MEKQGYVGRALQDYNEAIRVKPGEAFFFVSRGRAREKQGDMEGAREDQNEAIRLGYKPKT